VTRVLLLNSSKHRPTELLAADRTVDLAVVAKARHAEHYRHLAAVELVDDLADVSAVTAAALRLARRGPFDAVVAPVEAAVLPAAYLRSYLDVPGPMLDQALPLVSKLHTKRRLAAAGVPTTEPVPVAGLDGLALAAATTGWPVVVKPMTGAGGVNTHVIGSAGELARLRASGELDGLEHAAVPLVAERLVRVRRELHCDGVVEGGHVRFAAVSRYLSPLLWARERGVAGSCTLPESDPDVAPVRELHAAAVAALGLDAGVTHLECLVADEGMLVGEIACRPAGAAIVPAVERRHGVDLWRAFVDLALGRRPELAAHDRGVVTGWLGLPGQNGVVREVTPAGELAAIPGIDRVSVLHRPGQRVRQTVTTTFFAVQVEFTVPRLDAVDALVAEVCRRHRLAVDPEVAVRS